MDAPEYISIVGVGRSGTTLLMSMLNAHSAIAFPPEFHFLRNYLIKSVKLPREELGARLEADAYFDRLGLRPDEVAGEGSQPDDVVDLVDVYKRILAHFANRKGASHAGDKDPKNIEHLPMIAALFERPYVIHVIRDPRDVFLSRTKAEWARQRSMTSHLLAYRAQLALGRRGADLFGDRYVEVRYEDLVGDPEATLRQLCTRLGLPFEAGVLSHQQSARELVAEDEMQWKGAALEPVKKENVGKWKRAGLDRGKILAIESACSPAFTPSLYERSSEPESPLESLAAFGWDRFVGSLAWLYIRTVERKERAAVQRVEARRSG